VPFQLVTVERVLMVETQHAFIQGYDVAEPVNVSMPRAGRGAGSSSHRAKTLHPHAHGSTDSGAPNGRICIDVLPKHALARPARLSTADGPYASIAQGDACSPPALWKPLTSYEIRN